MVSNTGWECLDCGHSRKLHYGPEGVCVAACASLHPLVQCGCKTFRPAGTTQPDQCNHANEVPAECDCPPTCVCKRLTCWTKTPVQPPPVKNDNPAIQDLVVTDVEGRKALGIQRYGTALQAHNGRDMLTDAYEGALDLCIYLRGALYERDGR